MKSQRILVVAMASQIFLVAPSFSLAMPSEKTIRTIAAAEITDAEVMTVNLLLRQLSSKDLREKSQAAEKLSAYPFDEVVKALITEAKVFLQDVNNTNKAYPFTFSASIESLIKISTNKYSNEIRSLQDEFLKATTPLNSGWSLFGNNQPGEIPHKGIQVSMVEKWTERVNTLVSTIHSRPGALPSIVKEFIPKNPEAMDLLVNRLDRPLSPAEAKTTQELMEDLPGDLQDYLKQSLLDQVDVNHYDKSISIIKKSKGGRKFYGRDKELEQLSQALLRVDKGHALLTGKAGVGKTTILKMLTDGWLVGSLPFPGQNPPILLELSITDITNPSDPTAIKSRVKVAEQLAINLNRHVILMVDEAHVATKMARNALKSFLTQEMRTDSHVHMVWLTTFSESREFLSDTAFSRRWVSIDVREFTDSESIELVREGYLPLWRERHSSKLARISDISEEAYQTAVRYSKLENAHSGNPTGFKEILEGVIIHKLRETEKLIESGAEVSAAQRDFTIEPADVRSYVKYHKNLELLPGDVNFDKVFESKWAALEKEYVGNEGLKYLDRKFLYSHFSTMGARRQLTAPIYMGPPGAGKSFMVELISKHFFNTKPLSINGAKYSEGGLGLNTLIGSPTGTVGSEEQRSILTRYLKDNPQGGVIVFEEADLAHQDVFSFLVDAITSKEFEDGLGNRWNLENFLIILTTNVGQELMVATENSQKKLDWDDLEMRRRAITEKIFIDGQTIEVTKPEILNQLFERFMAKVSKQSNPNADSAVARTQNEKLERRFSPRFVMPPTQEELIETAYRMVYRFVERQSTENQVEFHIDRADVERILDVDHFRVKEGFSYVGSQLEKRLFMYLSPYINEKGKTIKVALADEEVQFGTKTLKGTKLVIDDGKEARSYSYGIAAPSSQNPWFNSPTMKEKLKTFEFEMAKKVMNQDVQIKALSRMLKQKAMSWSSRVVFTQLGTSGNGKTEFGYSMAEVLYGDRKAVYKISGINTWGDLQNYFRSPTGFVGNNEETEFERWFMARKSMGGGVIILDELLSFYGLNGSEMAEKIKAINKIYDMLDEGVIRFGNRVEDASGFIIEITGNAMQEFFDGIDDAPESEKLVQRVLENISTNDIIKYFGRIGIDPAKLARFGQIFVNGPLPKDQSLKVGLKDLQKLIQEAIADMSEIYDFDVKVDPAIVQEVVKRVSTVKLGMREVNKAIKALVAQPLGEIFFEHPGVELIELKLENGKLNWYLDGKLSQIEFPQLDAITEVPKIKVDPNHIKFIGVHEFYGHWMVNYLLNRKNNTLSISLMPGENSLGHVMKKPQSDAYQLSSISSWLKDIVELEAGHRAVFINGLYASGGGSSGNRKQGESPSDDLGKIENILDAMLSNHVFENFREFGASGDSKIFKMFMRDLGKAMADSLIRYGRNSKVFDPLFDELIQDRYLGEERIDAFVAGLPPNKLVSEDQLLLWSLSVGVRKVIRTANAKGTLKESVAAQYVRFGKEILSKTYREVETLSKANGVVLDPKVKELKVSTQRYLDGLLGKKASTSMSCSLSLQKK